jgi:GNAT superfamily N-acetyltransferase
MPERPSLTLADGRAVHIRAAVFADVPALEALVDASIRGLGARYYTAAEIESSMRYVFGVDTTMVRDGTYVVLESTDGILGAGGWSFRRTPFGGDQATPVRDADHRQPGVDPAVIRAMFVHPAVARLGIGSLILDACEEKARYAGFTRLELVATLSGVDFYERMGYHATETLHYRMADDSFIDFVRMEKEKPAP